VGIERADEAQYDSTDGKVLHRREALPLGAAIAKLPKFTLAKEANGEASDDIACANSMA
jgi:hypothetical protein